MPITKEVCLEVRYTISQDKETGVITLLAEVTRNEFIPAHVFLYRQNLDGTQEFCAIASVTDLDCQPANSPKEGSPFFRLERVELEFETAKDLKTVKDKMEAELAQLACDYQILVCELDSVSTSSYKGSDCC
jgi:hypothetical protein